ncbi:MAG: hypothetical protein V7744_20820 [Pseudomonadales bacterium]
MDTNDWSRADISRINSDVEAGKADTAEINALLNMFVENGRPELNAETIYFLRCSFRRFLKEKYSIEKALGLKGASNARSKSGSKRYFDLAYRVAELRLKGISHQNALTNCGNELGASERSVSNAWSDQRKVVGGVMKIMLMGDESEIPHDKIQEAQNIDAITLA